MLVDITLDPTEWHRQASESNVPARVIARHKHLSYWVKYPGEDEYGLSRWINRLRMGVYDSDTNYGANMADMYPRHKIDMPYHGESYLDGQVDVCGTADSIDQLLSHPAIIKQYIAASERYVLFVREIPRSSWERWGKSGAYIGDREILSVRVCEEPEPFGCIGWGFLCVPDEPVQGDPE